MEKNNNITPELTVIVPIYNVAPYIKECAVSLFNQTLKNIEYLFIDDASTDESLRILEEIILEFPNRSQQIKIIRHTNNKGISFTRQEGINKATGNWIIHCDSDDIVEASAYDTLISLAKREKADIVICGFTEFDESGEKKQFLPKEGIFSENEILNSLTGFSRNTLHGSLCNKIIKRKYCKDINFLTETSYCEDANFLIKLLLKNSNLNIRTHSVSLYKYRKHKNSITTIKNKEREKDIICLINDFENLKHNIDEKYIDTINCKIISLLYRLLKDTNNIKELSSQYKYYKDFIFLNKELLLLKKLFLKEALNQNYNMAKFIQYFNNYSNIILRSLRKINITNNH